MTQDFFHDAIQPSLFEEFPAKIEPVLDSFIKTLSDAKPLVLPFLFLVKGLPAPQGSKKTYGGRMTKSGKITPPRTVESNPRTRPWRAVLRDAASEAIDRQVWETIPRDVPVEVVATFFKPRPRAHYRTGKYSRLLKPNAPYYVTSGPDIDKMSRALLDAMTDAGVYADDKQVARLCPVHLWARDDHPFAMGGVEVYVQALSNPSNPQ